MKITRRFLWPIIGGFLGLASGVYLDWVGFIVVVLAWGIVLAALPDRIYYGKPKEVVQ